MRNQQYSVVRALWLLWRLGTLSVLLACYAQNCEGAATVLSLGTRGSQLFNTQGSVPESGEPTPCGEIGGASRWLSFRTSTNAVFTIDTLGSTVDTVLAVFTGTSLINLTLLTCDDNGAPDGIRSRVTFFANTNNIYYVAVDGKYGAQGLIAVNWCFGTAPTITLQPQTQVVDPGTQVAFSSKSSSGSPVKWQWRLNGVTVPGATNATYDLGIVDRTTAGSYTAIAANGCGAVSSQTAELIVQAPPLDATDAFAAGLIHTELSGVGAASSLNATREPGEPNHGGKRGGKSLWFSWLPDQDGYATFSTRGSSFDTLLAAYTGSSVDNLTPITSDDDGAGFGTSKIRFTVMAGTLYSIAIDGFAGAGGNVMLTWDFEYGPPVPRITNAPMSQSVTSGATAFLSVGAQNASSFQWYFNGDLLPNATGSTLQIANVQTANVGAYLVRIYNSNNQFVESEPVVLEIGAYSNIFSQDKFEDLFDPSAPGAPLLKSRLAPSDFAPVVVGVIGPQTISNKGSTTQAGETNHCGVQGGATRWFGPLRTTLTGYSFLIDTAGSQVGNVVAAYTGSNLLSTLTRVADDCSFATNGVSRVEIRALPNTNYFVAVDGTNGVQGVIQVNFGFGKLKIMSEPSNQTIRQGSNVTFVAEIEADPAPALQWYHDDTPLTGANSPSLELSNVQPAHGGKYSVVASNLLGTVKTAPARLSIATSTNLNYARFHTNNMDTLQLICPGTSSSTYNYVIEATTNFVAWLPLWTNGSPTFSTTFVDPQTNFAYRFYRLVPWP